jgi:hypothetical protein
MWLEDLDPKAHTRTVRELEPSTVSAEAKLLGDQVRRGVRGALPNAEQGAGLPICVALKRAAAEPPQAVEAARNRERHANARQVGKLVRNDDAVTIFNSVARTVTGFVVFDKRLGRKAIETGVEPTNERLAADSEAA